MKTTFTELMGVKYPIMQGGMHFVSYAELAAAVSNAGALGCITALTQPNPEALRLEIRKLRRLTEKPFAVNITLLPSMVPPDYQSFVNIIIEEKVPIVETAGRNPEKYILQLKSANIIVIHKCTSIKHALSAQRVGVDIISIDGFECAGHPGEKDVTNWVLAPRAAECLSIPFIISGSCVNGRQLAASLMLGGCGINCGTRFLASIESKVHENIKAALVNATEEDTQIVMRTVNNSERVFRNTASNEVIKIETESPGDFNKFRHLVKGENYRVAFQETGDVDGAVWSLGQGVGLIHGILCCKDIIEGIVKEAVECIEKYNPIFSRL